VKRPEEDRNSAFIAKNLMENVRDADYDKGRFRQICDGLEPPPEQSDGPRRLLPGRKLRRCGEWTDDAIENLKREGVLLDS
jgi:hypothetical protein